MMFVDSARSIERAHEYAFSDRKRALSNAIAGLMLPFNAVARLQTLRALRGTGLPVRYTQERVGKTDPLDEKLCVFDMFKLRTIDDTSGRQILVDDGAAERRRTRLDETEQAWNIFAGDMLAFGHRPMMPDEYEEFMDALDPAQRVRQERIVNPTYPGWFGTFAVQWARGDHVTLDPVCRHEMNVEDVMRGSIMHDLLVLKAFIGHSVNGSLVDMQLVLDRPR